MTREEAKLLLISQYARTTANSVDIEHSDNCVNIIYNDFEQHISELEAPKSCEGCEDEFKRATDCSLCHICSRGYDDMFTPKDK